MKPFLLLVALSLAFSSMVQAKVEFAKPLLAEELEIGTKLVWITSVETNMESFVIQVSEGGTSFDNITSVSAAGNSTTTHPYQFMDFAMRNKPVITYRLKMIDKDGTVSFTESVKFKRLKANTLVIVAMSPTVAAQNFEVTVDALKTMPCDVKLMNAEKKVVFADKKVLSAGLNTLNIDLKELQEGFYTLAIIGEAVETESVVIQKTKSTTVIQSPVASTKKSTSN
jgi:hypothetical protein